MSQKKELTIYIGPQTTDGFIDTDSDIVDSIKDIKSVFRERIKHVRIVDAPEKALLRLYVIGRGGVGWDGMVGRHLDTLLRVGDYEKPIIGVNDQWKGCAGQVVNKLKVWLAENNAKVQELLK